MLYFKKKLPQSGDISKLSKKVTGPESFVLKVTSTGSDSMSSLLHRLTRAEIPVWASLKPNKVKESHA